MNLFTVLNPKNWNIDAYSSTNGLSFGEAYKHARSNGRDEFIFDNKRYSTKYNGTPQEQLSQTGITDDQLQPKSIIRDRLANNLFPGSYSDGIRRLFNAVILNKQDPRKAALNKEHAYRVDANNLYFGKPQDFNKFGISKYKPTTGDKNQIYYSINDNKDQKNKRLADIYNIAINHLNQGGRFPIRGAQIQEIGNSTIDRGQDSNGKYFSVYDKWDLNPSDITGKPWELYDRYYDNDYDSTVINNKIDSLKNSDKYNNFINYKKRMGITDSYSIEEDKVKELEQTKRAIRNLFASSTTANQDSIRKSIFDK